MKTVMASTARLPSVCYYFFCLLLMTQAADTTYFQPGHTMGETPEFTKKREEDRLPHCGEVVGVLGGALESVAEKAAELGANAAVKNAVQASIMGQGESEGQNGIGRKSAHNSGSYYNSESKSYSLAATEGSTLNRVTSELSGAATAQSTTYAQFLALYTTTSGTSTSSQA